MPRLEVGAELGYDRRPDSHDEDLGDPTELVRASFAFLLEREPKESILSEFDLPVIGRYFPDHESEIRHDERSTVGKPGRVGSPGRR